MMRRPARRRLSLAAAGVAATVSLGVAAPIACTEASAHLPSVTHYLAGDR